MVDAADLKKRYGAMSNDQLTAFAHKEFTSLTPLAQETVLQELHVRGIDTAFAKQAARARPSQDVYEKLQLGWDYAFAQRMAGQSNEAIVELLKKHHGILEGHASVIIKHLPQAERNDTAFEELVRTRCESSTGGSVVLVVLLFGGGLFMMAKGGAGILVGLALLAFSIFILQKFRGDFKGGSYWATMIKNNPGNVVWIKPILEKTTLAIIITLAKTRKFQFLTRDNLKIIITCDSDADREIFLKGVKTYLPHAHVGYSAQVENTYQKNPEKFLAELQRQNIYTPL